MKPMTKTRQNGRHNGRKLDIAGARKVLEKAFATKRGPILDDEAAQRIIRRIKKTREELVRERFGHLFR